MLEPDLEKVSFIQLMAGAGAFVAGIVASVLGFKWRRRSVDDDNGNKPITKYDLMVTMNLLREETRKDRHDLYSKLQEVQASIGMDIDRVSANMDEAIGSLGTRIREAEREIDRMAKPITGPRKI